MKIKTLAVGVAMLAMLMCVGVASADTSELLQPAGGGTQNFESLRVGVAGQGGVTFFNGSVLNEGGAFTIADDVRIDGAIYRTEVGGDNPIKISDSMIPTLRDANDLGSSSNRWKNVHANKYYGDGSNLTGIITSQTETDPIYSGDPAHNITNGYISNWNNSHSTVSNNSTNWNTAYGWGNHASAGYVTTSNDSVSGSELEGTFSSNGLLVRSGVGSYTTTTNNSTNWNTAYGWGNHASAGYLTSGDYLPLAGGTMDGNINMDNNSLNGINSLNWNSEKTHYKSYSVHNCYAYNGTKYSTHIEGDGSNNPLDVYCDINLPQNATITGFLVNVFDNNSNHNFIVDLIKKDNIYIAGGDPSNSIIASTPGFSDSVNWQSSNITGLSETVTNITKNYAIRLDTFSYTPGTSNSNVKFSSFRIQYKTTSVD